jgi:EF-P beta-lysylation protein EpmB
MSTEASTAARPLLAEGWQTQLKDAIRDLDELSAVLELERDDLAALAPASNDFPLLVPRSFVARMRKGDPRDPLLRQVLPLSVEALPVPGFGQDPLAEQQCARDGVLEKYRGRALLIATAACPIHCRYCFRRHFPYGEQNAARNDWADAVERLAGDAGIEEVILSGGDPLSLSNRRLGTLVDRLASLEHLTTLRVHSRYPIVLPARIDAGLLDLLSRTRLHVVVVVHCNNAQEIDAEVGTALAALRRAGAVMLNQSVLLDGVNDSVEALAALSKRLFECGTLPYYLHELDAVAGAAHFDVPHQRGVELIDALRANLPGYLVPRLVRETPGAFSKIVLA